EESAPAVPEEAVAAAPTEADPVVEEAREVLSASRYQLSGTKVVGKIDLKDVEEKDSTHKRKRKRKRKAEVTTPGETPVKVQPAAKETDAARKKKKKRGPSVDEADVTHTLQETLRELEQGASRMRQ